MKGRTMPTAPGRVKAISLIRFYQPALEFVIRKKGEKWRSMAKKTISASSEYDVLRRLLRPDRNDLAPSAARAFLAIDFDPADRARMRELAQKAQEGSLTPAEQLEVSTYERLGVLLDLLQAKARLALKTGASRTSKRKPPANR